MAEKTAIMQLIKRIDKQLDSFPDDDNLLLSARGAQDAYINVKGWAESLLELEKKNIINACHYGFFTSDRLEGEQYYNETYKQD